MRPVSDEFLRTLRGSHVTAARARICTTFQTGTNPTGTEVPILSGDVQLDATADVRGTLEMDTDGAGAWPRKATDLLGPYGNEVFVERGLQFGDGRTEWVSQGYYRIYGIEQDDAPDGPITISARDRMSGLIDARLLYPVQFGATWERRDVLTHLVTDVYPAATIEWTDPTGDDVLGRALLCEEDRFAFLNDLVTGCGMTWRWDHRGVLVVEPPADPGFPVYGVNHGRDGVLVSMARQITREGVYNAVVAYGEAGDTLPPARAIAVDNNPKSATYFYGPFGKVPRYYSSPVITTNAQALSAATAILKQSLGLPYNVDFGTIVNPALEPGDPIAVEYPVRARAASGRTEFHVIDRLTVPLTADGLMTGSTREQTLVEIGEA